MGKQRKISVPPFPLLGCALDSQRQPPSAARSPKRGEFGPERAVALSLRPKMDRARFHCNA